MSHKYCKLMAIYYLTEEFLIQLSQNLFFFFFLSTRKMFLAVYSLCLPLSLGTFAQHCDTTVTQLSVGQAIKGSSLAMGPVSKWRQQQHLVSLMAPLCTAKIEKDCSARALLWTPTMNIHQPTLHLFDQLSVCASMCVHVWVLEFYSLTGCSLWNQSSQGFISFFLDQNCLSFSQMNCLHTCSYSDQPLPSPCSISPHF